MTIFNFNLAFSVSTFKIGESRELRNNIIDHFYINVSWSLPNLGPQ
jgi:hypothetical protein